MGKFQLFRETGGEFVPVEIVEVAASDDAEANAAAQAIVDDRQATIGGCWAAQAVED